MTLNQELDFLMDEVANIPATKGYWLIRTQSGSLYDTFRENNFVALEHTQLPLSVLTKFRQASAGNDNKLKSLIKKQIIEDFENKRVDTDTEAVDVRKSSLIANQIFRFVYEIRKGDIVIIPSHNSDLVSFGEVINTNISEFTKEESFKIDTDAILKKRVSWIRDISRRELDPFLYRMFTAHHALIDVRPYAEIIERSLRDFFFFDNEAHVIISIQTENQISAGDLFGLGTDLLYLIDKFSKDYNLDINSRDLQVSISLNSPGKIDLKSKTKKATLVAGLILAVFGGGYKNKVLGDLTTDGMPGLIKAIDQFRSHEDQRQMKNKIFNTYKDSLNVKDPEDMIKLLQQFIENKEASK